MKLFCNFIDNFTDTYRMTTIVILMMCFFICLYLEKNMIRYYGHARITNNLCEGILKNVCKQVEE